MNNNQKHITRMDPNGIQNRSTRTVAKTEPKKPTKAKSRDD